MAGIYIHIPFCKQACHYCNFHFSTSLQIQPKLVAAIVKEISFRNFFFNNSTRSTTIINTIYLGGGSPSLLKIEELSLILETVKQHFTIAKDAEITLEANPDDINLSYLNDIKNLGVNRLSLGIQSLQDNLLTYMNRAHNRKEALKALEFCAATGFTDLNVDVIFGIPGLSTKTLLNDISILTAFDINHFSCYGLTVEPNTALAYFIQQNQSATIDEVTSAEQFLAISNHLNKAGYLHYEISNYAKNKNFSKHNTAYWSSEPYLGIGPSAHSYKTNERSWNISNNVKYINAIDKNEIFYTTEKLSKTDQINEYLMTRLRTAWGVDMNQVELNFGGKIRENIFSKIKLIDKKYYSIDQETIKLNKEGWLWSDKILSELFVV